MPVLVVHDRVIAAAMAELQLVGLAAQREAEQLMAEADAEDRLLAVQLADVPDCAYSSGSGSPGPFERKTPSGFSASTSSAEVSAGTTVTRQFSRVSRRRMLCLMPKS